MDGLTTSPPAGGTRLGNQPDRRGLPSPPSGRRPQPAYGERVPARPRCIHGFRHWRIAYRSGTSDAGRPGAVHGEPLGAPGSRWTHARAKASVNRYRVTVKALYALGSCAVARRAQPHERSCVASDIVGCRRSCSTRRDDATWFPFCREQRTSATTRSSASCCSLAADWPRPARSTLRHRPRRTRRCAAQTKGGDPDRVMLSPTLATILAAHIARCADQRGPLFAAGARRLSTRQVQRIVVARVAEAGINKPITAHSLRHSFATALYNQTGDIRLVQQALRHTHVSTTETYAQVDPIRWRASVASIA
jgi:integrase